MQRRTFLNGIGLFAAGSVARGTPAGGGPIAGRSPGASARISLNAYSFNTPLRDGSMSVDDLIAFCARHGIGALDLTAYYVKDYPAVPDDAELYRIKRRAFVNGIALSGTGVRNDFTLADEAARREQTRLVNDWVVAAQKLGVPTLRVFAGPHVAAGVDRDRAFQRVVASLQECVRFGADHGVFLAIQNHDDFLKTAEQTIQLVDAVGSGWFGVTLDVGSLRSTDDPYPEIRRLAPYAVSWQLKELIWRGEKNEPIDLARIRTIVDDVGYRGVLQIETLGPGDPVAKVEKYLAKVRKHFPA